MKESTTWQSLLASILALILISTLTLSSCSLPFGNGGEGTEGEGTGNEGNEDDGKNQNQYINYTSEYLHARGDMGANTKLIAGKADIITDKRIIFTAGVTEFSGIRIGHGYT